ncbi:hypothetical protein EKN56_11675 [Limnobaculum zhutongyuii]|uniref:Uncharacterized protein n=1 Tax=Limnobaculum zhutongyuii TaxID=2498113 RepID=A0A411WLH8_9GAMM|nr:hypothetical protein [Limnobaculum zhutongyuii]QBH96997.1 hypothetical protein EKN56_11675 [Limnobaculum zhutongyuii]TQS87453.1 hypothetical protein ELQ32_14135 [Limnobaculum zhutongyuii]
MDNIRNRAWRLSQNKRKKHQGGRAKDDYRGEKNWKMLYTRRDKLARSVQLGIEYPRIPNSQRTLKAMEEV